ncbi:MAG TPA: lysophospholipid acyltransferase family protein, partial [Candidatus Polarisedimenticolaceae bacterium]|nr:lysophospholipid acyltransferase family protein [Candidatus Polarisedimenticolaceae bacterium]
LACGSLAGRLGYLLDGRHRRITLDNLRAAYGDAVDERWRRRVARRCWRHFGRITFDSLSIYALPRRRLDALLSYEGLEHVREAYARGRGVLFVSGHFGHWELTALMQGYLGFPLALVARRLDNPELERILIDLRQRSGNRVIHKHDALREMLRALREKLGVALLIDQDARGDGIFVPFFGRPASTTPALGLLAIRTGAPVIPTFTVPLDDGTYRVHYGRPVEPRHTGDRQQDAAWLTARCTEIIEEWVRRHPEAWLWMHRRWKTRPPPN